MGETENGAERTGSTPRPGAPAQDGAPQTSPAPAAESGEDAADSGEKPAKEGGGSDWFAPRKPPAAAKPPTDGPGDTDGAGFTAPGAGGPGTGAGGPGVGAGGPGVGGPGAGVGGAGGPGGLAGAGGPDAPAGPGAASGSGVPGGPASGGPASGGPGGTLPRRVTPPSGPRTDLPYFSDGPQNDFPAGPDGTGQGATPGGPRTTPGPGVRTPGPAGPTTGPVPGVSPLTPNLQGPGPFPPGMGPQSPGGPLTGGVPPRMSDDTAILTPQFAAPAAPGDNVSGDTLNSGMPVVPGDPKGAGPAGAAPERPTPAARPAPQPAPAKKGRSKLVLLAVAAVCLLGVAYGAGLLMNHSDVPKGTTVLGVDIGGGTKEDGVEKLDAALAKRAATPLRLSVDGKEVELAPDKAGLSLDSQATVRAAAGSDYNPVSVIGSLFGGERTVEPVFPIDEEKLGVALQDLAGASGTAKDGTIKFVPGKAVAVPGKAGKAIDVNKSMVSVRDAYRAQVETGRTKSVELPVVTKEPTVSQAELDRAMKEFAEPAMSGLVVIRAGGREIPFGPAKSLPQILSMVPVDGKLVDHYDKKAIDRLCAGVFDGVMITKGDGKKHQLSADDIAFAMKGALLGKTPAERTVTIDLEGNG
ncbi:peptidoglycan binding domain-containing protein [Streptomyces sp. NPDC013181]|uniref:peptidoglycan binding domain-containing protein n=2 Tax=unclassified Streptomyces TaxID=2593676 RepID=UPI00369A7B55